MNIDKKLLKKISYVAIAIGSLLFWIFCAVEIDNVRTTMGAFSNSSDTFKLMATSVGGLIFGLIVFALSTIGAIIEFTDKKDNETNHPTTSSDASATVDFSKTY